MRLRDSIFLVTLSIPNPLFAADFKTFDHVPARSLIENLEESLSATDGLDARPIGDRAYDVIMEFEGWVPYAYNDPSRYCTIGFGHLIALKPCQDVDLHEFSNKTLSPLEGRSLLEEDTKFARLSVQKLVKVDLNDDAFSALSSFVFNVGAANFATSTMLLLINDGHPDVAAKQFGRWVKSKGVVLPGLQSRRACERMLFEGQLHYAGKFKRSICESFSAADVSDELIDVETGE